MKFIALILAMAFSTAPSTIAKQMNNPWATMQIKVLNANIYGLPTSTVLNQQEFRFDRMAEAICNMKHTSHEPDVIVFEEMNAAFYDVNLLGNFVVDERINNNFRKKLHKCGYETFYADKQGQVLTSNPTSESFEGKPFESGWWSSSEFAEMFFAGSETKQIYRSGIMIAISSSLGPKYEFMKPFTNFNGAHEAIGMLGDAWNAANSFEGVASTTLDNGKGILAELASKGILYVTLKKRGVTCHIFGTHLDPYNTPNQRRERWVQLKQAREWINETNIHGCIIFAGDLNADWHLKEEQEIITSYFPEIKDQFKNLNPKFSTSRGKDISSMEEEHNPLATMETSNTGKKFYYDKSVFPNGDPLNRYYDYVFSIGEPPMSGTAQRIIFKTPKNYTFMDKRKVTSTYYKSAGPPYPPTPIQTDRLTDHDSILVTFNYGRYSSDPTNKHKPIDFKKEFAHVYSNCWKDKIDEILDKKIYTFGTEILFDGLEPREIFNVDGKCKEEEFETFF